MRMQFLPDVNFYLKKIDWQIYLTNFTESEISAFAQLLMYEALKIKATSPTSEIMIFAEKVLHTPDSKIMNLPNQRQALTAFGEFPILYPDNLFGINFNLRLKIFHQAKKPFLLLSTSGETDLDIDQILLKVQRKFQ